MTTRNDITSANNEARRVLKVSRAKEPAELMGPEYMNSHNRLVVNSTLTVRCSASACWPRSRRERHAHRRSITCCDKRTHTQTPKCIHTRQPAMNVTRMKLATAPVYQSQAVARCTHPASRERRHRDWVQSHVADHPVRCERHNLVSLTVASTHALLRVQAAAPAATSAEAAAAAAGAAAAEQQHAAEQQQQQQQQQQQ
jgi:hypothetical protein